MNFSCLTLLLVCAMTLFVVTQCAKGDSHRYPSKYRTGPPMPPRPPSVPSYVKKWHMPTHGRYPHRRPYSSSTGNGAHGFPQGKFPSGLMSLHGGTKHSVGRFNYPGITAQQYLPLQHKGISSVNLPPIAKPQPSKYEITKPQPSKYEITKPEPSNYENTNPQASNYEIQRIPQHLNVWNTFKQLNPQLNTELSKERIPFQSSPQINNFDYDYQLQTNSIPNHHLDDNSGPIHTIPAPNLSSADRPKNVEAQGVYPKTHHQPVKPPKGHKYTHVTVQKAHQYQVTETTPQDVNQKQLNGLQQMGHGGYFNFEQEDQPFKYEQLEALPQAQFLVQQPSDGNLQQQHQIPDQELLGLFNTIPQPPIVDVIALPLGQQHLSFEAAAPLTNYQSVIGSSQVHQPDYVQFKTDMVKHPEYHNFNYQENDHTHQKRPQQEIDLTYHHPQEQQLAQESYQQNWEINNVGNHHQQSGKTQNNVPYNIDFVRQFFAQQENAPPQDYTQSKEDAIVSAFYSTLPNKEAADALASLQEAGKLNTNAQMYHQKSQTNKLKKTVPMTIYVPDDFDEVEDRQKANISKKSIAKNQQYPENVSHDEDILESMNENQEFGERIKPKQ